jgi:hypothetical protein
MSTIIRVHYQVSDAYRQAQFTETGNLPEQKRSLTLEAETLTPEQRAQIFAVTGPALSLEIRSYKFAHWNTPQCLISEELLLEADPTLEDVLTHCGRMVAEQEAIKKQADDYRRNQYRKQLEDLTPKFTQAIELRQSEQPFHHLDSDDYRRMRSLGLDPQPLIALMEEYKQLQPLFREEKNEREEADKKRRKEEHAAQKARERESRKAWASEHGSERLCRALEAGHDCSRLYWTERASVDYPDYTLDYETHADWKDRACPSLAALDERDAVLAAHPQATVSIVWLTEEPRDRPIARDEDYYSEEFEACEAVVVKDPNYEHYLIRSM